MIINNNSYLLAVEYLLTTTGIPNSSTTSDKSHNPASPLRNQISSIDRVHAKTPSWIINTMEPERPSAYGYYPSLEPSLDNLISLEASALIYSWCSRDSSTPSDIVTFGRFITSLELKVERLELVKLGREEERREVKWRLKFKIWHLIL